tara:strand:+ start:95 stop:280 length:186 start_codon:yes stop_codon:yes gene_type:complete
MKGCQEKKSSIDKSDMDASKKKKILFFPLGSVYKRRMIYFLWKTCGKITDLLGKFELILID